MPPAKIKKNRKTRLLSLLIKTVIFSLAAWYVIRTVWDELHQSDHAGFMEHCRKLQFDDPLLWSILLLMPINWGLEAIKWRLLMRQIERVSFLNSIKAVCTGITISVFTPKRMGEFAGRVLYLSRGDRVQASLATIIGSLSQLLVTVIAGILSVAIFYVIRQHAMLKPPLILLIACSGILVIILLILYFNVWIVAVLLKKFKCMRTFEKYLDVFLWYPSDQLLYILLLSALRFMVFSTQFYMLLRLFGTDIHLPDGMLMIGITFFTISVIPATILSEIGVRESVSLKLIGSLTLMKTAVVASSFMLWIINIALPAIMGSVWLFNARIFRK